MIYLNNTTFSRAATVLGKMMEHAPKVTTERWQGVAANQETRELLNVTMAVDLKGVFDLDHWRREIEPNLPWADDAFEERVGGQPVNPGVAWKNWPWARSAAVFKNERFNHHYCERLWPKYARRTDDGRLGYNYSHDTLNPRRYPEMDLRPATDPSGNWVGDLWDLVLLLADEPYTRQAVIPLFWPSETGKGDGGRKMCSLLYHFIRRGDELNIYYPLRSCDFIRHWRDDCYLAVRMLVWVLENCKKVSPEKWEVVEPGEYLMHMTSLHVFESDMKGELV